MKAITKIAALLALAGSALALPEVATMEEALATATKENRNIFVDFTGTDWCTACIYLRNKIINTPEFDAALGDKFVLVPVDFPRSPALVAQIPDEEKKRREALLYSYKIEGLPGVVLMDSAGLPFEVIQGARRTPQEYIPLVQAGLDKLAARNAALTAAQGKSGMERATALDAALKALPEVCRDKYTDIIAEIVSLDKDNTLGYKNFGEKNAFLVQQQDALRELLNSFRGKYAPQELKKSIEKLDAFLAQPELDPEVRQAALRCKGDTYGFLHDMPNMVRSYREAYEAAPDSRYGRVLKTNLEYYEKMMPGL